MKPALCLLFSTFNAAPPNVIVFWTDDQGYADLSIHGNKDYETPHLGTTTRATWPTRDTRHIFSRSFRF